MSCSKERFISDVKDHEIKVLRDNGVDRHLRFRKDGTICYGFDLMTWDGHLMITGDCGTYVFRRIEDMFQFFRSKNEISINPFYWSEKVLAAPTGSRRESDIESYSEDKFRKLIRERFDDFYYDESKEKRDEIWERIEWEVFHECEFEAVAFRNAMNFEDPDDKYPFQNFWEANCREYTFSFLWCLYAIVWGIKKYDEINKKPDVEVVI